MEVQPSHGRSNPMGPRPGPSWPKKACLYQEELLGTYLVPLYVYPFETTTKHEIHFKTLPT